MQIVRQRAHARAGLLGNPSDGYGGRTLAVALGDFHAEVVLYEWPEIEIVWSRDDRSRFGSIDELARDVRLHGYYGGIRLVKATVKAFFDYCRRQGHRLHDRNFSVRYDTNIPRQVGLAGSSGIIVATLRALMDFYEVAIPREVQPSLALSVETGELGIGGGLQDRVAQVYEGLVYMDFTENRMREQCGFRHGEYEPLDPALLPSLYLAYHTDASEPTEVFHNRLRLRFEQGEPDVVNAMRELAELTERGREALLAGDVETFERLVDRNFDIRAGICRLPTLHCAMVERARRAGATAKFAGSGGAIVGTYHDKNVLDRLRHDLNDIGCRVLVPRIAHAR